MNDMNPDSCLPVRVTAGRCGDWSITQRTISPSEAERFNFCCDAEHGERNAQSLRVAPGCYWVLKQRDTVWMSNTPMETRTARGFVRAARGRVLVTGLGLGMVVDALLRKPEVTHVTVLELSPEVIALVGPLYREEPRVRIIQADAFSWIPEAGERFDWAWHDIWPAIDPDNAPQMRALEERYRSVADHQRCWASAWVLRQAREFGEDSFHRDRNRAISELASKAACATETSDGMRL